MYASRYTANSHPQTPKLLELVSRVRLISINMNMNATGVRATILTRVSPFTRSISKPAFKLCVRIVFTIGPTVTFIHSFIHSFAPIVHLTN